LAYKGRVKNGLEFGLEFEFGLAKGVIIDIDLVTRPTFDE